jgi:hypothetical protein
MLFASNDVTAAWIEFEVASSLDRWIAALTCVHRGGAGISNLTHTHSRRMAI